MLETFEQHSSQKGGDSDTRRDFLATLSEHGVVHEDARACAHVRAQPCVRNRACARACTSVRVRACTRERTHAPNTPVTHTPFTSVNEHTDHGVQKPTIWVTFPWNRCTANSKLGRVFRTFDEILPWNLRVAWARGFVSLKDKVLSR